MAERILLPLDGSDRAEEIVPLLRQFVAGRPTELVVLHIPLIHPVGAIETPQVIADLMEQARVYVARTVKRLQVQGSEARGLVGEGPAASTILDTAGRERVSLIAMTTHGRSGLARWALGSVAEKVVRHAEVPVLLVRSFPEGAPPRPADRAFKKILVPLDGSPFSAQALRRVKELARPLDARVLLVQVEEKSDYPVQWIPADTVTRAAQEELTAACIPVETIVRRGDPASEILAVARERDVDLVAMATHGRSGPSRWVFGSVTEKVIRAASCPLLVVHPPKGA